MEVDCLDVGLEFCMYGAEVVGLAARDQVYFTRTTALLLAIMYHISPHFAHLCLDHEWSINMRITLHSESNCHLKVNVPIGLFSIYMCANAARQKPINGNTARR